MSIPCCATTFANDCFLPRSAYLADNVFNIVPIFSPDSPVASIVAAAIAFNCVKVPPTALNALPDLITASATPCVVAPVRCDNSFHWFNIHNESEAVKLNCLIVATKNLVDCSAVNSAIFTPSNEALANFIASSNSNPALTAPRNASIVSEYNAPANLFICPANSNAA